MNFHNLLLFALFNHLSVICRGNVTKEFKPFLEASEDPELSVKIDVESHLKDETLIEIIIHIVDEDDIDDDFDIRKGWPKCQSVIDYIREDGYCRSGFASAVAGMLSDRECIITNGEVQTNLSVEELVTCCTECASKKDKVCRSGGATDAALDFWIKNGIVTGGNFGSNEGCKPYSTSSLQKGIPEECKANCTNDQYATPYQKDKHFGVLKLKVPKDEWQIQTEIFRYGSVVAEMIVYNNFLYYSNGVYDRPSGKKMARHVVRIIGWGVEDTKKYWLAANSWGEKWGELKGFFKILRGENVCEIEANVITGRHTSKLTPREYLMSEGSNSVQVNFILIFCTCILTSASILSN